ncbi:MAG: Spy/CpxP family protein refolding chaperone [Prevotella sp.]
MKKIVLAAAIALFGFGSMSAQRGGKQRMTPEEQVTRMAKELNLTSDQQKKITALYTDFQKKREAAGQDSREQMRAEREKLNKNVRALLTEEQQKKFDSMAQRGRGRK